MSRQQQQQQTKSLFIGNVAYEAAEKELATVLEAVGIHVFRVRIVTEQDTGHSRGFAFVDVDRSDLKPLEEIITLVNNEPIMLHGRRLRADKATPRPRKEGGNRPRGGRGRAPTEVTSAGTEFARDDEFEWSR